MNTKHLSITSTMSSPEEQQEEVSDRRLSFVFGSTSVVKPQTPYIQPEEAEPQELPEYYATETLCLKRAQLKYAGESILRNSSLKYLYLEGNQISTIPDSMFIRLPNLLWLDLRNNQIASLPAHIGSHRSLKTILLEGNPISELPLELGNVITLTGLNLRNCPITFPPGHIVNQGVQSILQYLRSLLAKRPVSRRKSSPELPVVEKLQLSELMEEQDEAVDEAELQRFRELKDKMILLDKAELDSTVQINGNPKSHLLPVIKRRKATTKASVIPGLPLFDPLHRKRPQERRQTAMKELKEKQAILEQRGKSQEVLQKITQKKKKVQKKHAEQRKQEEAETDSSDACQSQTSCMSITECEENRSARVMERQIRAHVEKIQERRSNPRGMTAEQMAATEHDVEEMRKLQARLLEKKRNQRRHSGKCFTVITGDTWQSFIDE